MYHIKPVGTPNITPTFEYKSCASLQWTIKNIYVSRPGLLRLYCESV